MKSEWILHGLFPLAIAWVLIVVYFRIADRFNIIDKPNERSSHKQITLRGAGIIFPLGFLCGTLLSAFTGQLPPVGLIAGLLAIAAVSFADDVTGLPGRIRIIVQILGVACLLASAGVYQQSLWIVLAAFIVIIGTINAYNFMDGINGITALYSLVSLITLRILIPDPLLNWLIAAVLVFSFYNLRTKARCFSGDVGSVSMAFILCYYILKLCIETGNIQWILLLGVYGIDSVFTIVFRMLRKENIFKAHRSHFYQFLANQKGFSHLSVSFLYFTVQSLLNGLLFINYKNEFRLNSMVLVSFVLLAVVYFLIRLKEEGSKLFQPGV